MPQVLAKLLIAFAASQWLYAELLLVHPEADEWSRRAMRVLSIPTHDKWPADAGDRIKHVMEGVIGGRPAGQPQPLRDPPRARPSKLAEIEMLMLHPATAITVGAEAASGEISALGLHDEPQYLGLFENAGGKPFYWGLEMFDNDRLARG